MAEEDDEPDWRFLVDTMFPLCLPPPDPSPFCLSLVGWTCRPKRKKKERRRKKGNGDPQHPIELDC